MSAVTPGRAACEAFWAKVREPHGLPDLGPDAAWAWAGSQNAQNAWEAAAQAVIAVRRPHEDGEAAYRLWAEVMATNGVDCHPYDRLGNVEQMAWREVAARMRPAPAQAEQLAEVRAVLDDFDWEHDDRQYALEHIGDIVNGRTR